LQAAASLLDGQERSALALDEDDALERARHLALQGLVDPAHADPGLEEHEAERLLLEVRRQGDEAPRLVALEEVVRRELGGAYPRLGAEVEPPAAVAREHDDRIGRRRGALRGRRVVEGERAARDSDPRQLGR